MTEKEILNFLDKNSGYIKTAKYLMNRVDRMKDQLKDMHKGENKITLTNEKGVPLVEIKTRPVTTKSSFEIDQVKVRRGWKVPKFKNILKKYFKLQFQVREKLTDEYVKKIHDDIGVRIIDEIGPDLNKQRVYIEVL